MRYKGAQGHAIGVRGIISDRNNKVLLLVNGKIMNGRALTGAIYERFISTLNDIERVEVIQSPQSSLYGPGAISCVISIYTKHMDSGAHRDEVQLNQGVVDNFTNIQFGRSRQVKEDLSYSLYLGGDYATGISSMNSPTKFTFDRTDGNGDTIMAGVPTSYGINNLNASYDHQMRYKAHAQIDYKNWSTWVRLTNGGMDFSPSQPDIIRRNNDQVGAISLKYRHLTAFSNYTKDWDKWGIDARFSYDQFSNRIENRTEDPAIDNAARNAKKNREDEFYSRLILKYSTDKLSIGFGPAISFEKFGLPAYGSSQDDWLLIPSISGYSYDDNQSDSLNAYSQSWSTLMVSGIGEMQYTVHENINILAGLRLDKHTYTGLMASPRASLVWRPKDNHLLRFQYSRSNRRQEDTDLRFEYLTTGVANGQVEKINFYELSGDLRIEKRIAFKPSIYYSSYDVVAWSGSQVTAYIGKVKYYGAEFSGIYKGKKGYGVLSHSMTKIHNFTEVEHTINNVSASAYGYGKSFHSFPDQLTKIHYRYKINEKMALSSSLQVTWYLYGAEDNANYNSDTINNPSPNHRAWDLSNGETTSYQPAAYLHAGYIYNLTYRLKGSLFFYNLLGLINENLNKRVEFQKTSHYRIQPASIAFRLDYGF